MYPTLAEIDDGLRSVMDDLDPGVLHGSASTTAYELFSKIEKMAATGRMLMGKRVAETNAWRASGKPSAEAFLASIAGCSLTEAHRLLGTAKKLGRLPTTEKAARRGELSTGQAGDIADAASVDPTAEQSLLDLSKTGSSSELREEARRRRNAATENDQRRHTRIHNNRAMRTWTDDEGAARLSWSHLPEAGAEVGAILADYIDEQFDDARRAGRRERREAYAADAFIEAMRDAAAYRRGETVDDETLADDEAAADATESNGATRADPSGTTRSTGPTDSTGSTGSGAATDVRARGVESETHADVPSAHLTSETDAEPSAEPANDVDVDVARAGAADADGRERPAPRSCEPHPPSSPSRSPSGGNRGGRSTPPPRRRRPARRRGADAKIIVVIDHAALLRGHTEAGDTCTIAGVGPVPVSSVRALMDDAFLAAVIKDGHDVSTVAHLGRQPNTYQQTAMQAQGIECSTLGCPNRARLERDHRIPYRVSRHTTLAELDWSCEHCHDRKTYSGDMLAPGTGKRPLLTRAEQIQWNLDHPDNPCDAPQTSYPNRPSSSPPRSSRPASTTPATDVAPATRPAPHALTLDLTR